MTITRYGILLLAAGLLGATEASWAGSPAAPAASKEERAEPVAEKPKAAIPAVKPAGKIARAKSDWKKAAVSALSACKQFDSTRKRLKAKMENQAKRGRAPDMDAATEALQAEWERLKIEEKIEAATDLAQELIDQGAPPIPLSKTLNEIKWKCEGKPIFKVDDRAYPLPR